MNKDNLNWRLPDKEELNLMYGNLHLKGVGRFTDEYYWSLSELDSNFAWFQNFNNGCQYDFYKYYDARVRAVRTYKPKGDFEIGQETESGFVFDIQRNTVFECKKEDEPYEMFWYDAMQEFDNQGVNK